MKNFKVVMTLPCVEPHQTPRQDSQQVVGMATVKPYNIEEIDGTTFVLSEWLEASHCQLYISLFVREGIDDYSLITQLDYESLKDLGILKIGDLIRLERSLNLLKIRKSIDESSITRKFINELSRYELRPVDGDFSESENDADSREDIAQSINREFKSSTNRDSGSSEIALRSAFSLKNMSSSTINSIESNESNMPLPPLDKNLAIFIQPNGSLKKINISGCFNAESIKRKLLKRLNLKSSLHTEYNTYFIDLNSRLHLMFDVELVQVVHSLERVERQRIIFCKSSEDPSAEAVRVSKKIAQRLAVERKDDGSDNKYVNVNTSNSQNLRGKLNVQPQYARKRPEMKTLYEQRPPSELISTNLAEYFPETSSKDLQKTIKNSVRYSVRMSRAFSRLSTMSLASSGFARNSIMNFTNNLQNSPRTIGDVYMTNASELDEAVLGDDKEFMEMVGSYKRPKSRFVPSDAPPLPEIEITPDGSPILDLSKKDRGVPRVKRPEPSKIKNRLSVAISKQDSKIELLDIDNSDSDIDNNESDPEAIMKDLADQSSLDRNTGPEHWLKGKKIGAGSFGTVYLGLHAFTGELMAVKQVELPKVQHLVNVPKEESTVLSLDDAVTLQGSTMNSNETIAGDEEKTPNGKAELKDKDHRQNLIEALQHEMELLKDLKHEKIVRYLGSSSDENYLNIYLEYVPGGSITAMLNNYGAFSEPLIRNFTRQILIGLKYLHSKNIIHRDIKGGNILIDNSGGVKISDFGISKKIETTMEAKRSSLQGSVYWMAPEVVKQIANSEKSDIWSVGCLIVEMFTGKHPFPEFTQVQAIFRIGTHSKPVIPEESTEDCKDFLQKTFILEQEQRPSAKELLGHPFLNGLIMSEQ